MTTRAYFFIKMKNVILFIYQQTRREPMKKKNEKNQYSLINNIAFYFKKLYEFQPSIIFIMVLQVILAVTLPVFTIYMPKILVDLATNHASIEKFVIVFGGFSVSYIVFSTVASYARNGTYFDYNFFRSYLMYYVFRKSLRIPYKYTESGKHREEYWGAIYQIRNGDWSASSRIYSTVPVLMILVLNFLIYSSILGNLNIVILILLIAISMINYLFMEVERKQKNKIQPKLDDLGKKIEYIKHSSSGDGENSPAKDIRIFHLGTWIKKKEKKLVDEEKQYRMKIMNKIFLRQNISFVLGFFRDGIAYIYLVHQAVKGNVTLGDFVLYLGAVYGFSDFVNGIIENIQQLLYAGDRAKSFRKYFDLQEEDIEQGTVTIEDMKYPLNIEFKDVCFSYDGKKDILKNLSFHIHGGEKIAIVGINGAGKTTIVKLLCGFYEPSKGEILINGININQFAKKDLYKLFSTVFQENRVFPFTVGENLTFQLREKIDRKRAEYALKEAGLWEKLKAKNISLDDYMTKYFMKEGITFSGGEMQRFILARAIYKDAPLLVLDEPTAALDPIAESEVYKKYVEISRDKTSIFISHRLASTSFSDRILFLKDGCVLESGSHEELMDLQGEYAHMFQIQSSYYQKGEV